MICGLSPGPHPRIERSGAAECHRLGTVGNGTPIDGPAAVRNDGIRLGPVAAVQYRGMNVRKPLLVLALAGSLVACGDNTDLQRGETNCDSSQQAANNPHDASCQETGVNENTK